MRAQVFIGDVRGEVIACQYTRLSELKEGLL